MHSKLIKIIFFILYLAIIVIASEDEERLVRDLFRDYNKNIRPVELINNTVEVLFSMSLIQLINVNEKNQVMTTNVWLNLRWQDYQLKWAEADYGSISVIRLPASKVWKPDIVLFNNADGNYEVRYKSNVLIYSDGSIHWVPPAIYQSSCQIDVTYFPFDQQHCAMKFSSWTFNGDQVSLKFDKGGYVDLSDYWKSGSWDVVEAPASLNRYNNTKLGRASETDITFHITIRRKTLFYTVNLILPTLLISFLCILVFYLPVDSGEKVTLGISILLSLVVFLLLVSKILPPTSLVLPLIAKYLLFTFIMNCISILVTVIIINCNFRSPRTHTMPNWTRIIFLHYLPILLFLRRPKRTRLQWMRDMPALAGSSQQKKNETMKSSSKKAIKKENKDCQSNVNRTVEKSNSVKRKDSKLIKQASTSSQHQQHSVLEHQQSTIESPKQPLQQLNVTTLPMTSNLIQFPLHNHFHTLSTHHHFHHPSPLLMQTASSSHFHPSCTLTPQTEQLHHHLNTNQQTVSNPIHAHHYGSDAHLMRAATLDNNLSNSNLINPNFDHLTHLLNTDQNSTAAEHHHLSTLPSNICCLPQPNLNDVDHQNENLNHLNLHHSQIDFSLNRNEINELNSDHCMMQPIRSTAMQSVRTNELNGLNENNLGHSHASSTKQINQRPASSDSSSSSSFYLSQAAFKATEAIEFLAEHLRNEDEYIQIKEDWAYVAMVIDRLQLYIFFFVTVFGTMAILLDAPHLMETVNQDEVIRAHSGVM